MAVAAKRRGLPTSNKTAKLPPSRKSSRAGGTTTGHTATSTTNASRGTSGGGAAADRKGHLSSHGASTGPSTKTAPTTATAHAASSSSPTERMRLDSTVLARGMTARYIGARVASQISILTKEEIEKDLRHMEAFANTCVAYAQQFFLYHNRGYNGDAPLVTSDQVAVVVASAAAAAAAPTTTSSSPPPLTLASSSSAVFSSTSPTTVAVAAPPPPRALLTLPVRIDPEEEKRLAQLRKKIAFAEAQREILETQYMSLRAHNVEEWQRLGQARTRMEHQLSFLRSLVQTKGKVLHMHRVRVQMTRDVLAALQARQDLLHGSDTPDLAKPVTSNSDLATSVVSTPVTIASGNHNGKNNDDMEEDIDLVKLWNRMEDASRAAEAQCCRLEFSLPSPATVITNNNATTNSSNNNKSTKGNNKRQQHLQQQRGSNDDDKILPWQSLTMPRTPPGMPVYLSQLSLVADRGAAYSANGVFGAKSTSMCWLESNLPKTIDPWQTEKTEVQQLRDECEKLQSELHYEQSTNQDFQRGIRTRRQRLDELCIQMTVLRSETEAVLARHNILLDTHHARAAAKALHTQVLQERRRAAAAAAVAMTSLAEIMTGSPLPTNHLAASHADTAAGTTTMEIKPAAPAAHRLEQESSSGSSGDTNGVPEGTAQGEATGENSGIVTTEPADPINPAIQPHHEDVENDGDDEACDEEEESEIMDDGGVRRIKTHQEINHAPTSSLRDESQMPHEVVVNPNVEEVEDLEGGGWSGKRSLTATQQGGVSEEDVASSLAAMGGRKRRKV